MFEKVNPSHPDKVADRIAGAVVDLGYAKSKNPKVNGSVSDADIERETSAAHTADPSVPVRTRAKRPDH